MKKLVVNRVIFGFICLVTILMSNYVRSQSVGINNPNPDPSSILDLKATDRGVLIPRVTDFQMKAIKTTSKWIAIV